MELSGQLHAPLLLRREETNTLTSYEAGWAREPIAGFEEEKISCPAGIRTLYLPARSLVTISTMLTRHIEHIYINFSKGKVVKQSKEKNLIKYRTALVHTGVETLLFTAKPEKSLNNTQRR